MQAKIHEMLVDAGAAHGITSDEAMILIALGNDMILNQVKAELKQTMSDEEYANACQVLDECAVKHRAVQQKAVDDISKAVEERAGVPRKNIHQQIAEQEALSRELNSFLA